MDARRKQDVLQNAVAKTGKALLRREKRLCAERTRAFGKHLSEMRRKVRRKRRHRRVPLLRRTHKAVFRHKAAPFSYSLTPPKGNVKRGGTHILVGKEPDRYAV